MKIERKTRVLKKSLASAYPDIAAQWHPTKNGEITPDQVSPGSNDKYWWQYSYDDPETGKHFDFEWPAQVNSRARGRGCPFITGNAVWPGFNDLATKRPALAAQWHPSRNGDKTPDSVTCGCNDVVWWYLPYDDPETGKHFDFEWPAQVNNRARGRDCPFITGKSVWPGFNDLATKRPDLAAQWHPSRNGDKTPDSVTCGCNDVVWWYLPYDDPETGKHFDFEWPAKVKDRAKGNDCPFLSGRAIWSGFNDLATKRPDLAAQWHPSRNGNKTPDSVTCGSDDVVWWYLPYDDPETGKHFDFEWPAQVNSRARGRGCPFITGNAVWPGFNDLATKRPDLAGQWHPSRNGDKTPDSVTCTSADVVWWYLPYDDPETGKHFDFEWPAKVSNRSWGGGCPFITGNAVWPGFNDLATKRPDLAAQWHPSRNGDKTPDSVTCGCNDVVWWYLPYDDPETGKHFDFEWPAQVDSRSRGCGCPFITGNAVWPGFNDLATKRPDLAAQWHPSRNGDKTPDSVTCGSGDVVWWYLPYDDPGTGKHFDFEWPAQVTSRSRSSGCPFITGNAVWPGFNDLATKRPDLAAQWHPSRNGDKTPDSVTCGSGDVVWWYLPYDDPGTGKHFDFEWPAQVGERSRGRGCPFLSGKSVWLGFNDLATKRPDLAAQWHPSRNGDKTPDSVTCGSGDVVWWYLPYDDPKTGKHFDFEWPTQVSSRSQGGIGCPFLSGKAVWTGFNDLEKCYPDLAAQWHPSKNRKRTPDRVYKHESIRKTWWLCPKCGHEWRATVYSRIVEECGCPKCRKEKKQNHG